MSFQRGFHFLLPPIVLIFVLIKGYTPMLSAIVAMATMVVTSYFRKDTRMGLKDLLSDVLGSGRVQFQSGNLDPG